VTVWASSLGVWKEDGETGAGRLVGWHEDVVEVDVSIDTLCVGGVMARTLAEPALAETNDLGRRSFS
jgi:hypothetical protein